jgi:dinuclear metal center YbgI/SA1388 family protein
MKVKDIVEVLEAVAPPQYQEGYDNAGLIIGNPEQEIQSVLLCLDSTEAVIDEAIRDGHKMILAHHPVVFKGLKRINGNTDVERTIIKAIQNNIAIYAAHTNLDNVLHKGVNEKFCQKLGLENLKILQAKKGFLVKLVVYVPETHAEKLRSKMFELGAGHIGMYSDCSFTMKGKGTFRPGESANPHIGRKGELETVDEIRLEAMAPTHLADDIIRELKHAHPYEEMAYEIIALENYNQTLGSGMVGELPEAMEGVMFLEHLKKSLNLSSFKYTEINQKIKRVAVCGGSGSFLLSSAIRSKADAYITSDVKYHEFFDALGHLMFCDIGHYESEISTLELFCEVIQEKYPNFAVAFCGTNTNPIHYYK